MRKLQLVLLLGVALSGRRTASIAQSSPLVPPEWFRAIRGESSGELPFADFRNIHAQFSGFARLVKILERAAGQQFAPFQRPPTALGPVANTDTTLLP